MTLQKKLEQLNNGFASLEVPFSHYWRPRKEPPFGAWEETGEDDSFYTGNKKTEQVMEGTADYFTKTEFDPIVDAVQSMLQENTKAWKLASVQYEEETGLIHYEWNWKV